MAYPDRRKSIDAIREARASSALKKTLGWPHLLALGVGAIVGTGIYTLTGVGAGLAGPAVLASFVIAGAVCAFAALAYAEMATMIPAAGSAYTYSYAVLGETIAWIIGWSLILEYTVVCSAVAVGWSAHAAEFMRAADWGVPEILLAGPDAGGLVNLPAVLICFAVAGMLLIGTRESATVNLVLVIAKTAALGVFVALVAPAFDVANFHPFAPFGFAGEIADDGTKVGIMAAASIIFFAFYGFDTISTAAEETRNPDRDLKIGIIGSMLVCVLIYLAVAGSAIGAMAPSQFAASEAPLVFVLEGLGHPLAARIIAGVAVIALPTVILAFMYGQSRIFFVMARDGLLPRRLARVSASGAPVTMTIITAVIAAAIAGAFPLGEIAALANAGTLAAFIAVAVCMMVLRLRDPHRPRVFRSPVWWLVGPGAVLGCLYLFVNLPTDTIVRFFIWNAIGLALYLAYGRRHSVLAGGPKGSDS